MARTSEILPQSVKQGIGDGCKAALQNSARSRDGFCRRVYRRLRLKIRDVIREQFRRRIAFTHPSPPASPQTSFSPHALVCHADILFTVCSAKCLNLALSEPLPWIFHDDGSLTSRDKQILIYQFPGCRLIERKEADLWFETLKLKFPAICEARRQHVFLLKLADLYAFSDTNRILYADSDVLFFKRPEFIMGKLLNGDTANYFNKDVATAYIAPPEVLRELTGIQPMERLNAGLSILNKEDISLIRIEQILSSLHVSKRTDWTHYSHLLEQTIVAVLASASRSGAFHMPRDYDVVLGPDIPLQERTARHYVGVIRHLYELEGLRMLLRDGLFVTRWQDFWRQRALR